MTVHGGHGGHGSHDLRWEMTGDFNVASITVGPSLRTLPLPIFVWRVELRFEALWGEAGAVAEVAEVAEVARQQHAEPSNFIQCFHTLPAPRLPRGTGPPTPLSMGMER
ncbi:hypothetical protein E4U54_000065 [Claviceps lovelessii]|nr:hypothetical protein E4U54_000065 [Claviceps lovelessii]